jgi:hypothetical protein
MLDTAIWAGVTYSFYTVPYSMLFKKLDKKLYVLQKKICGLPNCTPSVATQLLHDLFGMGAFSFKTAYLRCIGEQLKHALNDKGQIGKIYTGLINYLLPKFGGALNLHCLTSHDCVRFLITKTLFLLKNDAGMHLQKELDKFCLFPTPLERQWMDATSRHLQFFLQRFLRILNTLLLHYITNLLQFMLPNLWTNMTSKYTMPHLPNLSKPCSKRWNNLYAIWDVHPPASTRVIYTTFLEYFYHNILQLIT